MTTNQLAPRAPPSLAIAEGATTPSGVSAGALVWSTTIGGLLVWNGVQWVAVAADVTPITASEALAAGDWVNVWNSSGTKVRKANATAAGKEAVGFVLAAAASSAIAYVYFDGTNTGVTGQTVGKVFLSTTAGSGTTTAPTASGNVVQRIGTAVSATAVKFAVGDAITLA